MSMGAETLFSDFEKIYWKVSREMTYIWKGIFEQRFPGSQAHILFSLERSGPKRMAELAEDLYVTPSAITSASDKLIQHEFIARRRDSEDRRVVYLEITKLGKEVITELQDEGREAMKSVFSHVSKTELEMMIRIFESAVQHIDNFKKE